jgi:hypothetical protein
MTDLVSRRHPSALGNHLFGADIDIGSSLGNIILIGE